MIQLGWSNRAESIRPVIFSARLRLALAGSLALHLLLLVVLSTGSASVGGRVPFIHGEGISADTSLVKRVLSARLSAVARHLPTVDALVPIDKPQPKIVINEPNLAEGHSNTPQITVPSPGIASAPVPAATIHPVRQETLPAQQSPPAAASPSPTLQENSADPAETAARRAGYLTGAELDKKPGLLSAIDIEYPESAGGQTGRVVLQLFIDELGYVKETIVVQAVPPGFFEQAAISAFSRARFSPGMLGGRAVKSLLPVEIDFSVFNRPTATSGKTAY
ncbi:MAG TPA: TonB family protein [Accumulibacter sp.]|nr:TonB family protein [Accumulibacter sp.]